MKHILAAFLILASTHVVAECAHLYPNQKPIIIKGAKELCNSWYVVLYDEKKRAPILASEILNGKETLTERNSKFRTDTRVKFPVTNSEYNGLGMDRGHLTAAGNASNQKEMDETFLLTNAVPQAQKLNRGAWRALESRIRSRVKDSVYIVTGAVYGDMTGLSTIPIPSKMFKVVYYPSGTEYWIADNVDDARVLKIGKAELESMAGVKF